MLSLLKQLFRLFIISSFIVSITGKVAAQQTQPIPIPLPKENLSLYGFAAYTLSKKTDNDFKTLSSYSFLPLQNFESDNSLPFPDTVKSAWIFFAVRNNLPTDTSVVLKIPSQTSRVILYQLEGNFLKEPGRAGSALPVSQLSMQNDFRRIRFNLEAGATQQYFLQQQRYGLSNYLKIPELQSLNAAIIERSYVEKSLHPIESFTFSLVGFHFAIFLFSIVKYNKQQRDKAYLWYGLFNLMACVFALITINVIYLDSALWNNLNQADFFLLFNGMGVIAYLWFQVELLQLKQYKPKLVKSIKLYAYILSAGLLLTLVANQLGMFPAFFTATRAFSHTGALFFIMFLLYLKNKRTGFYKYIYYGILSWFIGLCLYIPYIWLDLKRFLPPIVRGNSMMGIATAVEVFLFLKALVYRDQETELQKIHFQQQLIMQLEHNRELQQSFTEDLAKQVKDRTAEIVEQRKMMEQEREQKLRADFERRFSESELKALRSQINPHFIFNVLNTIESFALENNAEAASDMIQKFSRLTRLVLENSLYQVVPIENDLEALTLYIELEQIRYSGQFSSHVQVDDEVLEGNYCVPPMIIQPYVENAILHGLRNLQSGDGTLRIHVCIQASYLNITIEDNGIGRAKATALRSVDVLGRTSIGMTVTQDRISIFNNLNQDHKATVTIYDLETGTRVDLKFPLAVYHL